MTYHNAVIIRQIRPLTLYEPSLLPLPPRKRVNAVMLRILVHFAWSRAERERDGATEAGPERARERRIAAFAPTRGGTVDINRDNKTYH